MDKNKRGYGVNCLITNVGCKELTESSGTTSDMDRYLALVRERIEGSKGPERLLHQWQFLEDIGLEEFYGCDLNILPFLEQIPPGSDIVDIRTFLQHGLVEALLDILESGTSTVLLDVEKMKETPAEVLIPKIEDRRREEIASSQVHVKGRIFHHYDVFMNEIDKEVIPSHGNSVNLEDLWFTAIGYQVLIQSGVGVHTDIKGLKKIERALKKHDVSVTVENAEFRKTRNSSLISDALRDIVLSRALQKEFPEKTKRSAGVTSTSH
ncbi:MAG: hypothetical protein ACW98Y_06005 [Candidatus Thorarchaeota archaeon]|jgi:hypothetical protein